MFKFTRRPIIFFTFFSILIINVEIYAQQLSKIIPPSPTASSIAQFADVPVSNYTGLPNIDIPIYTINSGVLTVPISLQYHGGGIKVAQEASWVGLGWSLNCGGSVSRIIKGNDDLTIFADSKKPYINSYNVPESGVSDAVLQQYYRDVIYRGHDPEPDIFFYNFGPFSGKFVVEKPVGMENELIGRPLDAQAVKIRYLQAEHLWKITDPSGIEYRFSVAETTTTYSYSSDSQSLASILANRYTLINDGNGPDAKVTTWYLKEIYSPVSVDKITFEYESNLHNTKSQIRVGQQGTRAFAQSFYCAGTSIEIPSLSVPAINAGTIDVTQDVYLSRINYPNGYVLFNTDDRIDQATKSPTDPKPQRLYNISAYSNLTVIPIVSANFNFDYFKTSTTELEIPEYYRLKLNDISINDQHYGFDYNDPGSALPSKISLAVDHWGYFNNATNNTLKPWAQPDVSGPSGGTLIPSAFFNFQSIGYSIAGADRNPKENFTKYCILQKIKLPTGGTQTFNWESNKFYGRKTLDGAHTGNLITSNNCVRRSILASTGGPTTEFSCEGEEFEIISGVGINLNLNFFIRNSNPSFFPQSYDVIPNFGYSKLENGVWVKHNISYPGVFDIYNGSGQVILNFNNTILTAGKYKIFMSHPDNLAVSVIWSFIDQPTTVAANIEGSGLRIKSIEMHDGIKATVKNYRYLTENAAISSGLSMPDPGYHYSQNIAINASNCIFPVTYLIGSSSNILPLSATGNTFVGYSRVSTSYNDDLTHGETISQYYNSVPYSVSINPLPNSPVESDPKNGKLSRVIVKNEMAKTIQESTYSYLTNYSYRKNALGMYIFKTPIVLPPPVGQIEPIPLGTFFSRYNNYTDWCYLASETTTHYDLNGNNPVTELTQYSYENELHLQPTKIITTDHNGGQTLETRMAYPLDLPGEPNAANLITQNRKSIPLKVETYRGTDKLSEQITKYGTFSSSTPGALFTLPEFIWEKKGDVPSNTLQKQVSYNYDDSGNLIEYIPKNAATTTLIWGYNKTVPIAKIENATYSEVSSQVANLQAISNTGNEANLLVALETLRNTPSLANAMITTYTHIPHVGASTITDPKGDRITYSYDIHARLINVKDKDGKILSENQYYYKN